ncbi:uncharacterized protein L203_102069 [Cryptococcus depauperatus CBS 7841]|uniref:Uncharacterized protein n=1 Tax=Cryptococcus depauperatus CBS 7841 TaxID=1295531 RepID=A0A1E3IRB8_9TREE|nr:hypothetical protein L203_01321 [Cryptococcus depauperatus CBS 7841]
MDLWSSSIDILFLILTLLLIPSISRTPQLNITPPDDAVTSPPVTPFSPLTPITPGDATSPHLNVPGFGVPSIILTPSETAASGRRRTSFSSLRSKFGSHKRKSVSFSLSALEDVLAPHGSPNKRRPPTPFVMGPNSPRSGSTSPAGSNPASPVPTIPGVTGEHDVNTMTHRKELEDPMGVKKRWLMV